MIDLRGLQSQRESQLARLPCAEANGRVDRLLEDRLRRLCGHLLDLHPSGLRCHKDQLARGAVEHNTQVELAFDRRGLLDEKPLHLLALGSGLVGLERHAQNVLGVLLGLLARPGHLHAAAFAAASGVDLRLHRHARGAFGKQLARHVVGFFQRVGNFALGHGDAVLRQDFFSLIFVDFHSG